MKVKFWGTRGSIPVPGRSTLIYGGNTPSIQITSSNNDQIFLDAGSGFREAGIEFVKNNSSKEIHLFMSHFHWDHILGLPFFIPFYNYRYQIYIYGTTDNQKSVEEIIDSIVSPPLFPITKNEFKAKVFYNNISPDAAYKVGNIKIKTFQVNHQCCTLAYRIEEGNKSFIYVTDNEIKYSLLDADSFANDIAEQNSEMIKFCKGADYLMHDTTYTFEDYSKKIGWGHSNNFSAVILASLAEVTNLVLFHYDPEYHDSKVDSLINDTKIFLKRLGSTVNCFASCDGMELEV
jgi:phosphoribosyl 1,2-cyclic phosphodiesterase